VLAAEAAADGFCCEELVETADAPVQAEAAGASTVVPIIFPLENRVSWVNTYGASRDGGARTHLGDDLMAPKMTKILAVVDGTVDWLNLNPTGTAPSFNILLRGDDGNIYFYVHLNNDTPGTDDGKGGVKYAYAKGLTNGQHVKAGDHIGYVGDSGNAESAGSHLHFEIHVGKYGNTINPYASLKAAPTFAEQQAKGQVPGFTDVFTTDWYYEDFKEALEAKVVVADSSGLFQPNKQIDRALFATYMVRAVAPAELEKPVGKQVFKDVPPDHAAYKEIQTAARLGLIQGYGKGVFGPDKLVTRGQMASIICRALIADWKDKQTGKKAAAYLLYKDVPKGHLHQAAIVKANELGLLIGDDNKCFRPEENASRAHAVTLVARVMRMQKESK